jgi:hypothetical protein
MEPIARVKLRWSGFIGGPGYTVLHFRDFGWDTVGSVDVTACQAAVARVDTLAAALNDYLPYGCQLQTEAEVEVLNAEDGELMEVRGTVPAAAQSAVVGSTATFAGPVGAVINWKTGGVRNGRRVHGRSYLVPLVGTSFATDGTLTTGARTDFAAAATVLANPTGTPDLGVWARPTRTETSPGVFVTNSDGSWHAVTSSSVPDMAAVLRSRRD